MIFHGHVISVPKPGKLPNLADCEDLSAFELIAFTPLVDPFLRPEEQHRGSGENKVVVPLGEGEREVDKHPAQAAVPLWGTFPGGDALSDISIFYFQLNRFVTFSENSFNDCVTTQCGGDPEHIPGTVGEISLSMGMHLEIRGNSREWVRHADIQGAWFKEEGVTVV
jgi:hypothetical protein